MVFKTHHQYLFLFLLFMTNYVHAKDELGLNKFEPILKNQAGWFSVGIRSTMNVFSDDGFGIGAGGQFRVQLNNRVNTDWFADYIVVNNDNIARSEYLHIGWSVLFYPVKKWQYPRYKVQPFLLAGHCFDYNKKTILSDPGISKHRWGAAVQMGLGSHFHLSERFDLTVMVQYMIHLTKELEVERNEENKYEIEIEKGSALEGHLLCTLSLNYKIAKLWKR